MIRSLVAVSLTLVLASCGATEQRKLSLEQVFHSSNCAVAEPVGTIITDQSQWLAITGADGNLLRDSADTGASERYQILVADSLLVLVAAGSKPSAGYDIRIDTDNWKLQGDTLLLRVQQTSPAPDSMQASVITSPCVVVAIRGYRGIEGLKFSGFSDELVIQLPAGS